MRPNGGTCQAWRTSALAVLSATVVFLHFAAGSGSESETKVETYPIFESGINDEVNIGEVLNGNHPSGRLTGAELSKELGTMGPIELEGLLAYYKDKKVEIPETKPQGNGEALIWKLLFYGISKTAMKSLIEQVLKLVLTRQGPYRCYDGVGCFYLENRMALEIGGPVPPKEANVKFYFHSNGSHSGTEVPPDDWAEVLKGKNYTQQRSLVIIFHGFKESSKTKQVVNLTNALLEKVDCDVMTIDWKDAAAFPQYGRAAANSPMAGALASVLLQSMYFERILNPENVHLIGFSLGAHAAGFCGRHFENKTLKKLGRVSGLDPAGLLFENENLSLSSSDASFVDVIHTNGGLMTELRFGGKNPMGHLDFYPNGGTYQPGCTGALSDLSCSHNRGWWYFIESVRNETCFFRSIHCEDWYSYDLCLSKNTSMSANMGFRSTRAQEKGSYYLRTHPHPPYCILDEKPREGIILDPLDGPKDAPIEKAPR